SSATYSAPSAIHHRRHHPARPKSCQVPSSSYSICCLRRPLAAEAASAAGGAGAFAASGHSGVPSTAGRAGNRPTPHHGPASRDARLGRVCDTALHVVFPPLVALFAFVAAVL